MSSGALISRSARPLAWVPYQVGRATADSPGRALPGARFNGRRARPVNAGRLIANFISNLAAGLGSARPRAIASPDKPQRRPTNLSSALWLRHVRAQADL